jgi:acetyltransferase EpsM
MHAEAVVIPEQEGGGVYWIAGLAVREGQVVETGQLLARLESSQGSIELRAVRGGFVVGLHARPGQTAAPGDVLCFLAERSSLAAANPANSLSITFNQAPLDPTALLVYGGGGHGKAMIELVRALGVYRLVGVIDDELPAGGEVLGVPVMGGRNALKEWHQRGVRLAANGVGGIGKPQDREKVFGVLAQEGFSCPPLVHPSAVIEPSAVLEGGVQVMPLAYVGGLVRVGFGSVINIGAYCSHDCVMGRVANLSPGATLAGNVHIGDFSQIGMNTTVNLNLTVGAGCMIGNGATVKADVPPGMRVWAGSVWPPRSA